MRIITERTQARIAAARLAARYARNALFGEQVIWASLPALDGETATAADIAAIIGDNSWCGPSKCNECGCQVNIAVEVGEAPDIDSRTATLCLACLEQAAALIRGAS